MSNSFFVLPPVITATDYLPESEARKTAGARLMSPPTAWVDEITQNLLRDHPYIPADRVVVNFRKKDDGQGYATGFIGIQGAPRISIPLIVTQRELQPLDVMILRNASNPNDAATNEGSGDLTEDRVMPLTETNFSQGLDVGEPGSLIHESKLRGAGWTEDGSALRLPYRGRTVLASAMGITEDQRQALHTQLSQDKQALAGFTLNNTGDVLNSWINAPQAGQTIQSKLASAPIQRAIAIAPVTIPSEASPSDFLAARVWMDDTESKVAVSFKALDLFAPDKPQKDYLIFEDTTYCEAPEKVACDDSDTETPEHALTKLVMDKVATRTLPMGSTISLEIDGVFTAPAILTKIAVHEETGSIQLTLSNGLQQLPVVLARGIKTASQDSTGCWVLPVETPALALSTHSTTKPMALDKVASFLDARLPDSLTVANGQWSLSVRGEAFGCSQVNEKTASAVLSHWFENGAEMLEGVKKVASTNDGNGWLRFNSDLPEVAEKIASAAGALQDFPKIAEAACSKIAMPLDKAVKLAAAIGDPQCADAILGTGFLTPDNLAEFASLHAEFDDSVQKLARLLLAIRMGFPGDAGATAVAMKSLQRVSEDLESAMQEV